MGGEFKSCLMQLKNNYKSTLINITSNSFYCYIKFVIKRLTLFNVLITSRHPLIILYLITDLTTLICQTVAQNIGSSRESSQLEMVFLLSSVLTK